MRAEALGCDLSKAASRQRLPGSDRVARAWRSACSSTTPGFATGGPFHESDPARELEQVRVLVEAAVALMLGVPPGMVRRGPGAVLNVASTAGMQPLPYSAGYSAAKAYVLTFSEALHHELRGSGVTVTALAPGPVSTEFWDVAGWEVGPAARRSRARCPRPPGSRPSRPPRRASRALRPVTGWSSRACRCAPRCSPVSTCPTR